MHLNGKCKSKAMQVASLAHGVTTVAVEEDEDRLVVIGNGVDAVSLTQSLRKKVGLASLVSVEEVEGKNNQEDDEEKPEITLLPCQLSTWNQHPQILVVDNPSQPYCSIL
ncbi:hypothetical protein NMG60_11002030 [Bertholletia excelsa]